MLQRLIIVLLSRLSRGITGDYPGGVTVTHAQMATIHLTCHRFHGEWNYTIQPTSRR
jgi:hypothetical protein